MTPVLICGTGSGAHALAGILSSKPNIEVRILTSDAAKVQMWTEAIRNNRLTVTLCENDNKRILAADNPVYITDKPELAARDCGIVVLVTPAFRHPQYLSSLEPYIEQGCIIIGLPGQPGFEFEVRAKLGQRLKDRYIVIVNFESLPWTCRVVEFGRSVEVLGTKATLVGAIQGDLSRAVVKDPLGFLQSVLNEGPRLVVSGDLLGITLRSPNACAHPPIMYGRWKDWDGEALESPPSFYQSISEDTASLLGNISCEVVATSKRIMTDYPEVNLSQVIPIYDWDIGCYGHLIKDKTSLMTALRTNSAYDGIKHPMIKTDAGKYIPNFNHRFLTEDVPFGLVVVRGIAEIAGVSTPCIDRVLYWCQDKLQREYLVGSRLTGRDLPATRCPQRYGFQTIAEIVEGGRIIALD